MNQNRYTINYRKTEVHQIMHWLKAGASGCIVGLRGAGKSNFLRFLLRQDVQQDYLEQDSVNYVFSLINLLALADVTEQAVYRLILASLLDQLRAVGREENLEQLESMQSKAAESQDDIVLQQAIEQCLRYLCRAPKRCVVLLFDEFDGVFQSCDASLFRFLRAVRDAHKEQISYLIIVTRDLTHLRDDLTDIDHFFRLVARNVCGLGPYNQDDARQMLDYLAAQRALELTEDDSAYLIEQSGGHAGLLKSIFSQIWDLPQDSNLKEIVPIIEKDLVVQAECQKVWRNLPESEQIALHNLIAGQEADPYPFQHLKRKGLVRTEEGIPLPFSPVFANFVGQQIPPSTRRTIIRRSPPWVQLEGRLIKTLTDFEFEALCYLYEHQGQVCTKDELIKTIYRHQYEKEEGGLNDVRLQQLISRLRKKIELTPNRPGYIVTIRGEGYKFIAPLET